MASEPSKSRPVFRRGEIWAIDLNPQTFKAEPGKLDRPALILQTDKLNHAEHDTVIIIPGTSLNDGYPPDDDYPLIVRVQKIGKLTYDANLLIDQVRAVSIWRLRHKLADVQFIHLKKITEALQILMGR